LTAITFSPQVEQWRPIVSEYVAPQYVDKFLWTMSGESGGDPSRVGDSDSNSIGLMQIRDSDAIQGRPTKAELLDPRFNIQYAAQQLGASNGRFTDWGDGTYGTPQQFGALGDHPFPNDGTATSAPATQLGFPHLPSIPGLPDWLDPSNLPDWLNPGNIPLFPGLPGATIGNPGNVLGIKDVYKSVITGVATIGKAFIWLLDPRHWIRLFFIGSGAVLFIAGVFIYVRGDKAITDVQRVGTSVGKAAAESGAA
jgi:hypothetical protein